MDGISEIYSRNYMNIAKGRYCIVGTPILLKQRDDTFPFVTKKPSKTKYLNNKI